MVGYLPKRIGGRDFEYKGIKNLRVGHIGLCEHIDPFSNDNLEQLFEDGVLDDPVLSGNKSNSKLTFIICLKLGWSLLSDPPQATRLAEGDWHSWFGTREEGARIEEGPYQRSSLVATSTWS